MAIESTLISAAVGGGCVLAGTIISQAFGLLSGSIQRRHDRDVRQRERLERLADAVGESLSWFPEIGKCKSLEDILSHPVPASARRASVLADLYFPSLVEPAADYVNALLEYYHLALDCIQPDQPGTIGMQLVLRIRSDKTAQKICDDALNLRNNLDEAIAVEAKKYFHT